MSLLLFWRNAVVAGDAALVSSSTLTVDALVAVSVLVDLSSNSQLFSDSLVTATGATSLVSVSSLGSDSAASTDAQEVLAGSSTLTVDAVVDTDSQLILSASSVLTVTADVVANTSAILSSSSTLGVTADLLLFAQVLLLSTSTLSVNTDLKLSVVYGQLDDNLWLVELKNSWAIELLPNLEAELVKTGWNAEQATVNWTISGLSTSWATDFTQGWSYGALSVDVTDVPSSEWSTTGLETGLSGQLVRS